MLRFIKKHLKKTKKDKKTLPAPLSVREELVLARNLAKENQHRTELLRTKIFQSIADLIHQVYDVPADFWYDEFNNYEKIRNDKRNENIEVALKNKCDKLILSYAEQIDLINDKIKFYEQLVEEYSVLELDLMKYLKKQSVCKKDNHLTKIMEKHEDNINNLWFEQSNDPNVYIDEKKLELLEEDIENTRKELKIKQQVENEIKDLIFDKTSQKKYSMAEYRKEILRLTEKIKSVKNEDTMRR